MGTAPFISNRAGHSSIDGMVFTVHLLRTLSCSSAASAAMAGRSYDTLRAIE